MASSRQRERELARRRYQRQQARKIAAAKRRRRITILTASIVVVVLAVTGGIIALVAGGSSSSKSSLAGSTPTPVATSPGQSASPAATGTPAGSPAPTPSAAITSSANLPLACYQKAPPKQPPVQKFSAEPPLTVDTSKKYTMTIDTTCGIITAALDVAKAPHTVNSFAFLASKGFFTNTECHRVTTTPGLTVLQCGDPTATGSGGPGYTFKDENLTGATYPRGTLAMANSGPNTNGSQFFLVDKDSQLPASYTPFGTIDATGLAVLDKILSHGVAGNTAANPVTDGRPAQRIFIKTLKVTAS